MALTPKKARFVAEFSVDLNATQAAIRAGYSAKTAASAASRLLTDVKIRAAIAAGKAHQITRADLSAVRVLEELRRIAFHDHRKMFYPNGNVKPITELDDDTAAGIVSWEVITKNAKAGDGIVDEVLKVRTLDKTKALDTLAKHFGLLVERLEHGGTIVFRHELPE